MRALRLCIPDGVVQHELMVSVAPIIPDTIVSVDDLRGRSQPFLTQDRGA